MRVSRFLGLALPLVALAASLIAGCKGDSVIDKTPGAKPAAYTRDRSQSK